MKWFKEKHDQLCANNPCICWELKSIRNRQAMDRWAEENLHKMELAQKALDGEQG